MILFVEFHGLYNDFGFLVSSGFFSACASPVAIAHLVLNALDFSFEFLLRFNQLLRSIAFPGLHGLVQS